MLRIGGAFTTDNCRLQRFTCRRGYVIVFTNVTHMRRDMAAMELRYKTDNGKRTTGNTPHSSNILRPGIAECVGVFVLVCLFCGF